MKNVRLVTAGITSAVLLVATTAAAAPTIYATRAAFDTAFPGLPIETFQGLASNAGCPSPMSSTTPDNMCFTQGGLLAGFTVGGTDAHPTDGISLTDGPTGRFIKTSYTPTRRCSR